MNIRGKARVLNRTFLKLITLSLGLAVFSAPVKAGFEVMGEAEEQYGNAQSEEFRRAVAQKTELSDVDRKYLNSVEKKRVGNRWYYKAQIARPTVKLKMVTNESTGIPGQPPERSVNEDVFHFILGWGYKWTRWATEIELLIAETFDYRTNPVLVNPVYIPPPIPIGGGQSIKLEGNVKHFAFFWNFEYEVPTFFDFIPKTFHPYINAGIGTAVKTTDSQTFTLGGQARQNKSSRSNDFAWHAGLGVKYQVTGNILIDIAYRWMMLGDVKFGTIEGLTLKARDLDSNGFYLGLTYQL